MELRGFSNGFLKSNEKKKPRINAYYNDQDKSSEIHIGESMIKSSDCVKLLGMKIDSKLNF